MLVKGNTVVAVLRNSRAKMADPVAATEAKAGTSGDSAEPDEVSPTVLQRVGGWEFQGHQLESHLARGARTATHTTTRTHPLDQTHCVYCRHRPAQRR